MFRAYIILLLLWVCVYRVDAQKRDISILRSLDDNKALAADTNDLAFHRKIKMIPLAKGNPGPYFSIGGEIRGQVRASERINFGDVNAGADVRECFFLERYMLHTDIHVSNHIRLFAQLTSNHVQNKKELTREIERDDLDIMQAFIDLDFKLAVSMRLRMGRQDFLLGSERMIGAREGPNVRLSFEGIRYSLGNIRNMAESFIIRPVIAEFGLFDDAPNLNELIYGAYSHASITQQGSLEVYYLGANRNNATYVNDTADEHRQSIGLRYARNGRPFFFDGECTLQFGKFGNETIQAWQFASFAGYRWMNLRFQPQIRLSEFVFSGDLHTADGRNNTFRPIAAKPPGGDLLSIGPANAIILSPDAEITLYKQLSINLRYQAAWRYSTKDGLYTPNVKVMYRNPDAPGEQHGKFYLQGLTGEINYSLNKHISFNLTAGYFIPEAYARNTGMGADLKALSAKGSYKF